MQINLTRAVGTPLALSRQGEALTFNGVSIDLSIIPEGATMGRDAHDCPWIVGPVTRAGGVLTVPILAPYSGGGLDPALWSPAPIIDPPDGPIALPAYEVSDALPD